MALKTYQPEEVTGNDLVDRINRRVQEVLRDVTSAAILDHKEVEFTLASGSNDIDHGLGREPRWIIADIDAAATVYREESPVPKRILRLNSSAAATVKLWLY